MALVAGTNCGLVTTAPTTDPSGTGAQAIDDFSWGIKFTTSGAVNIDEVGVWIDNNSEESNFEIGIYSDDAANNAPEDIVHVSRTNAKGTTSGWKTITGLSWALNASTDYWVCHQVDNTATATNSDWGTSGTQRYSKMNSESTLADPWAEDTVGTALLAVYAHVQAQVDVTITPSALTLSLTDTEPIYVIQVPSLALGTNLSALSVKVDKIQRTGWRGTIGTLPLDKNYPYVEGLTAETTKQTNEPNLIAQGSNYV